MLTSSLGFLAVLAPVFSRASPIATPINPETDAELLNLLKRDGNMGSYGDYFPDCSADPSYSTGKSQYKDGEGHYVTSSCDNKMYNKWHCWTDLYVVTRQASYSGWQNSGQVIDCASTSNCNEVVVSTNQTCTTSTTTWDNQFGAQVSAQFPLWFNKDANISPQLSYNHNFGGANSLQICTTTSGSGTCTWDDKKCHAIWAADRNIQVNAYLRRSCNSPRDGTNVPNSSKRDDGYYTVGMQDLSYPVPNNRIIGCNAGCGDLTYPNPAPGPDPVETITP